VETVACELGHRRLEDLLSADLGGLSLCDLRIHVK
jgi:hypothetical protein